MKGRKLARWMGVLLVAILLLSILSYQIFYGELFGYERGSYDSPDGRYRIVVQARGVNLSIYGFGDGGAVPANVSLIDNKTGRRIGRQTVDRAYLVNSGTVIWSPSNVVVVDVGEWKLPSGKFDPIW